MNKNWFFHHADLLDSQRCFDDEQDFMTFVHLMGYKSGVKINEVFENE